MPLGRRAASWVTYRSGEGGRGSTFPDSRPTLLPSVRAFPSHRTRRGLRFVPLRRRLALSDRSDAGIHAGVSFALKLSEKGLG